MKFALIDGVRHEPQPGLAGQCPGCGQEVLSKCGTIKIWHWAHKGKRTCDPWWEPETEWHRTWKNTFPVEWQEVPMRAEDGELHIADIRTPNGTVIEFQHSAIKLEERISRERFYKHMLWVVDGTRLKRDMPRVDKEIPGWRWCSDGEYKSLAWPEFSLPCRWIECEVPVLFDFEGFSSHGAVYEDVQDDEGDPMRRVANPLFCLLPHRFRGQALYTTIRRETLPKIASDTASALDWREAHRQLTERHPEKPKPRPRRFTNHRNWPFR